MTETVTLQKKIDILKSKITDSLELYQCPLCGTNFSVEDYSLVCCKRHTFDFSKKGCVNFFKRPSKITETYDKALFTARKSVSDNGLYSGLCDKLTEIAAANKKNSVILDAGSGGGNITASIAKRLPQSSFYAIDLSKDAVEFAALNYFYENENISWFVGNLNDIPLQTKSVDIVLNIMSPSNYSEFYRVLKDDGVMIKVLIESNYLKELRSFIYRENDNNEYSNKDVFDHAAANMKLTESIDVSYTHILKNENLGFLFDMTPLTKNIAEREKVRENFINSFENFEISLAFKIIICRKT